MDDLIAFLKARLDEEESAAKAWSTPFSNPTAADRENRAAQADPDRVLREAEAKRAILAEYERIAGSVKRYPNNATITALGVAETMVRAAGTVYSDHPDYRSEWKPR